MHRAHGARLVHATTHRLSRSGDISERGKRGMENILVGICTRGTAKHKIIGIAVDRAYT